MPDITLCVSDYCELSDECYRHYSNRRRSERQSYASFQQYEDENGIIQCDMFIENPWEEEL